MKLKSLKISFIVAVICSLLLAACSTNNSNGSQESANPDGEANSSADNWPNETMTIIVPFDAGGSADRSARGFAQYMSEELGQNIVVQNYSGSGGLLGAMRFIEDPGADEGNTLFMAVQPNLSSNIVNDGALFTMEDYAFINAHWSDSMVVSVPKASEYDSLEALVNDIKNNPKQVTLGTIVSTAEHLYSFTMLDKLGILDQVNVVYFDGGNDLRTALLGGHVDFIVDQLEGALPIIDQIKPLATVTAEESEHLPGIPTINGALAGFGAEVPIIQGSIRVLAAKNSFKENYPERWEKLVSAYQATIESDEFKEWLSTNKIPGDWHGPETSTQMVMDYHKVVEESKDLLQNN